MTAAPVRPARRPASSAARPVHARRVKFRFADRDVARHFVNNDIAMSHLTSVMSAGFPEHRNLNRRLQELGYPTEELDRRNRLQLQWIERYLPPLMHLAMTAAAEHGTALLAENVLGRDEVQTLAYDEEVRRLLNWHAFEELEHKAVAFDVYRAVGGPEWMRIMAMVLMWLQAPIVLGQAMNASLATDPAARNRAEVVRSLARIPRSPVFRHSARRWLAYLRPGFHPDDIRTDALLEKWRAELFGAAATR